MNTGRRLHRIEVHRIDAIAAPPRRGNEPLCLGHGKPANAATAGMPMRLVSAHINHALLVNPAAHGVESACASVNGLPEPPR